jgi:hypothetical protein
MTNLLRHAPFTRFLIARVGSIAAQQMLMLAISWHMYDLTSSAWDLGLVGLCQFVPGLHQRGMEPPVQAASQTRSSALICHG